MGLRCLGAQLQPDKAGTAQAAAGAATATVVSVASNLACGTMKEELLAAQEVLHGKAEFEPSSEQLFLSQLQKVLAMGANAARLLSLQQQELE
ncbi:hypothetical protein HaLaN_03148 [Haematococcus lacustris]|uniref:Uncharacterized protein n=1 Tax=Haematococcus lacustris TaxID=44745 RepID=A0A699YJW5_HAELA|nr:hypothetical protein HaLaN_03148 [Haematococcus lacustris]